MVRPGRQGPMGGRSPLLVEQLTWRADTCGSLRAWPPLPTADLRAQALGDGPARTEIWRLPPCERQSGFLHDLGERSETAADLRDRQTVARRCCPWLSGGARPQRGPAGIVETQPQPIAPADQNPCSTAASSSPWPSSASPSGIPRQSSTSDGWRWPGQPGATRARARAGKAVGDRRVPSG